MKVVVYKNISGDYVVRQAERIEHNEEYTIPSSLVQDWANDLDVRSDIINGYAEIGNSDIFYGSSEGLDYLLDILPKEISVTNTPPFSSKMIGTKKVFRRKHGFNLTIPANSDNSVFLIVPYTEVLINEVELMNCHVGDSVDFSVYDSETGLYQQKLGVPAESVNPELKLNQFGFNVNLPDGFYRDRSEYDAQLFGTMRIKITYYNNTNEEHVFYGNIVYHELV